MKCGFYELDITPALGTEIPGYFEARIASGVLDPLSAHAVYIENDAGERLVVVSADTIFLPDWMAYEMRAQIARSLSMPEDCVTLCATHSHTAGPVWSWGDFLHEDRDYVAFMGRRMHDAALLAAGAAQEAVLRIGVGHEAGISFYRDFVLADGSYKTNPGLGGDKRPYGKIDADVGVLCVDTPDGKPLGALINFACHLDCVSGDKLSADYPGEMKKMLRAALGAQFVPVFMTGFCGNINHCDFEHDIHHSVPAHYKRMGRVLAGAVLRAREFAVPMGECSFQAATQQITIPTRRPAPELLAWAEGVLAGEDKSMPDYFYAQEAKRFEREGVEQVNILLQAVRIGPAVMYVLPGEIYVEFAEMLKDASPAEYTFCVALSNGMGGGYVPIRELFQPGIYEARLASSSRLIPDAGYIQVEGLLGLSRTLWS